MELLDSQLEVVKDEERASLVARRAAADATASKARTTVIAGMAASMVLLGLAFHLVRREALRRSRAEIDLDRFFDVSLDPLCFAGFDGRLTRMNPAWERLLGYSPSELRALPFGEFIHPDDRRAAQAAAARLARGRGVIALENRVRARDGSYRWLSWTATSSPARGLVYAVAHDVTDRKRRQEERERLIGGLRAALANVRTLSGLLPMCAYCKRIRDDQNYWQRVERYLGTHTDAEFSHGICPTCLERVEQEFLR